MNERLAGLIAAVLTPMHKDGSLNLAEVGRLVDHLDSCGVSGIYIGGSTGEGMSLTGDERRRLAEAFVAAARGRLTTIVQVGHNSLEEARQLAEHAQQIGADAVSATAPSYFKITSVDGLIAAMQIVAAGSPGLPFYYYHIPVFTGAAVDMQQFLEVAEDKIPNLRGIKYTAPLVHEFQSCLAVNNGAFDVVWGTDEMLLSGLVAGSAAAIGSTYNVAAPLYLAIIEAFRRHDIQQASRLQLVAVDLVRVLLNYPFLATLKYLLSVQGLDCGSCRPPQDSLTVHQKLQLESDLEAGQFSQWLLGPKKIDLHAAHKVALTP